MSNLKKPKKFRFQLFHEWIVNNVNPCKVADIGGGNGLLSYLLNQDGFNSVVIDPISLKLPWKYRGLNKKRYFIKDREGINRVQGSFNKSLAPKFDLYLSLHAHGVNINIIKLSKQFNKKFAIVPCCIVKEPLNKPQGINWFNFLIRQAEKEGHKIRTFDLNFKGKHLGICNF